MELVPISVYCGQILEQVRTRRVLDPDYQIDWHNELRTAGYHEVVIDDVSPRDDHWQEMATWCQANIGHDHWIWLGYDFWFSRSEDAVLFSLRWT
jgi:hypothetical protein